MEYNFILFQMAFCYEKRILCFDENYEVKIFLLRFVLNGAKQQESPRRVQIIFRCLRTIRKKIVMMILELEEGFL